MKQLHVLLASLMSISVLLATGCATVEPPHHSSLKVGLFDTLRLDDFLAEESEFAGLKSEALSSQLNAPWSFSIEVNAAGENTQAVSSCTDYFVVADKAEPVKPHEYSAYRAVGLSCQAVQQALSMKASAQTFMRNLAFDKALADKLPDEVALVISSEERKRLDENTDIHFWSDIEKILSFEQLDTNVYHYKTEGVNHYIKRLALGDTNGDGVEDLLIRDDVTLDEGSYRASRLFVLTKRSAQAKIEVIERF